MVYSNEIRRCDPDHLFAVAASGRAMSRYCSKRTDPMFLAQSGRAALAQ
jgi:hypothetical protein